MPDNRSAANVSTTSALILAAGLILGLLGLGYCLGQGALAVKALERTVVVKGLAELEQPADIVIWPIQFTGADNNLPALYTSVEADTRAIIEFLRERGIQDSEISTSVPAITDKLAQQYGGGGVDLRYTAVQTVTVYSSRVDSVRLVINQLSQLGKRGIAFSGGGYPSTEYLFTGLNAVKPAMIEEATRAAREVAEKFAEDSNSKLGKIKSASQGQFSISDRDNNNPHIKNLRVVSTVEYYLSD